ncbi:hypothetical protein KSP40_PGU022276 [Platanthera guangdongensis]|uniref:Prenylcysteine lyase domain-containing protein n=1 Tax=Platanthera guangdongensis TaxID=2320717 RepID=A0ABR2LFN4_9ASPA
MGVNIQRDSYASYVGHYPMLAYFAIAENESIGRERYNFMQVITRINYGQDISISGLAGAVSLAGSYDGLWSVDGANWQLAAGLISYSNAVYILMRRLYLLPMMK